MDRETKMLRAPRWCKDARLTTRGWVDPRTDELLVSRRTPRALVEAYYKEKNGTMLTEEMPKTEAPAPQMLNEVMPAAVDFNAMTKVELDEWAKENLGLDLDRRQTKASMIAEIKQAL